MATKNDTSSSSNPPQKENWLTLQFHDQKKQAIMKPHEIEEHTVNTQSRIEEKLFDRIAGSMLGLVIGDALGAHVEFRPHEYLAEHLVTDLTGGGTWGLEKGQFTDDTSMALCLAISLIACQGFNPYDQLVRYKWWYRHGYMSSTGQCFDIGAATKKSIEEFESRQHQWMQQSGIAADQIDDLAGDERMKNFPVECDEEGAAGNGALMRLAPVPLFFFREAAQAIEYAGRSSVTTHADVRSIDACRYYAALIVAALHDESKDELLHVDFYTRHQAWFGDKELHVDIMNISGGSYQKQEGYEDGIRGSGYVVKALEAALWAFWSTSDFEAGALAAVNLGDDTDTTAAIYGQLAGAFYDRKNLPEKWIKELYAKKFILNICGWIGYRGKNWGSKNIGNESAGVEVEPRKSIDPSLPRSNAKHSSIIRSMSTGQNYEEYLRWTYDDVSYWLETLNPDFHQYVHRFKRERINGEFLLKSVNGRILEGLGIHTLEDRATILDGIEKLKSEVSSDFYKKFLDDDFTYIWSLKKKYHHESGLFSRKVHEHMQVLIGPQPLKISYNWFNIVPDSCQFRIFLQQILSIEYQCSASVGFLMTLGANLYLNDQVKVVTRMKSHKRQTFHKRFAKVCIVRGWYGCAYDEVSEIVHNGFKNVVKMGPGDNDIGFCFKSSFKAAAEDVGFPGFVIMCYIILRHPFPTVIDPKQSATDSYRYRFYSDGRHSIYQEECPKRTNHQQQHINDRIPEDVNKGLYDEFVTFQKKDILQQVIVYLKPSQASGDS